MWFPCLMLHWPGESTKHHLIVFHPIPPSTHNVWNCPAILTLTRVQHWVFGLVSFLSGRYNDLIFITVETAKAKRNTVLSWCGTQSWNPSQNTESRASETLIWTCRNSHGFAPMVSQKVRHFLERRGRLLSWNQVWLPPENKFFSWMASSSA